MPTRKKIRKERDSIKLLNKRFIIAKNWLTGKLGEMNLESDVSLEGHDIKKVHEGRDFVVQKKKSYTDRNIGKPMEIEVKTGDAKLSEAQKREKKRLGKRYKVYRA